METFEADRQAIHELVGLPYKTAGGFHDMKEISGSEYSTQDWTRILFKNITQKIKEKLLSVYASDFELFGYNQFLY